MGAVHDRAVLAAALDPIITIDAFGVIRSASDSVQRVFGWTPQELVGRNVSILMPDPHRSAHDGYLSNYRRTGKTNILGRTRQFQGMRRNGELFPLELSVARADPPGGGMPLFVGIIRDISDRVRLETELESHRRRLEEMVEAGTRDLQRSRDQLRMADRLASIGTLGAGLGHDMNNVLLPVRARLNALRAEGETGGLTASARRHVESIRKSVAYLQQLADSLHFLAMDPEQDDGSGGPVDLAAWWSQAGPLISKAVPRHARVSASVPPGLPRAIVAEHGLTQAILNLVVNAGEAIPPPGPGKRRRGRVRIAADTDGRIIRLSVSDNGQGMTEEVKRRAFEMFFTTKPRGLGTGLGLALVHKVAERAGGIVEIDSAAGKGTTVTMVFPAALDDTGRGVRRGSAVITLDDGRAAAMFGHLLASLGFEVRRSRSPGSADLWLTDPGVSRLGPGGAWRTRHPAARLVLLGGPDAATAPRWAGLKALIIRDPGDLDAARVVLRSVVPSA